MQGSSSQGQALLESESDRTCGGGRVARLSLFGFCFIFSKQDVIQ